MQVHDQSNVGSIANIASANLYQSRSNNNNSSSHNGPKKTNNNLFLKKLKGVSSAQYNARANTVPLRSTLPGIATGHSPSPSSNSRQGFAKQRIEF